MVYCRDKFDIFDMINENAKERIKEKFDDTYKDENNDVNKH